MPALNDVLAVILGGGRGNRLYPLTKTRSKPAVSIAGKYRLIDIPISNCLSAGIYRIAILTQFNSASLHEHITQTYQFDHFHAGGIQILAAEQTLTNEEWYQGTADAVRKQIDHICASGAQSVLILAGDHLYHMDYAAMVDYHRRKGAGITVAVQPVSARDASRFGVLKRNGAGRIIDFCEKPDRPDLQRQFASRDDARRPYLASLGIYLFDTWVLIRLLNETACTDFGSDLIPGAIHDEAIYSFDFEGYWEDIGTIRSYYEANLALTCSDHPFDLYDPGYPIYTRARSLSPSRIVDSAVRNVLMSEGCRIDGAEISDSIIGVHSRVCPGARLSRTILLGCDEDEPVWGGRSRGIPCGVGPGCQIEGAIIDENACLGAGVIIRSFPRGVNLEAEQWAVRDGIPVVFENAVIPPGTVIAPDRAYTAPLSLPCPPRPEAIHPVANWPEAR